MKKLSLQNQENRCNFITLVDRSILGVRRSIIIPVLKLMPNDRSQTNEKSTCGNRQLCKMKTFFLSKIRLRKIRLPTFSIWNWSRRNFITRWCCCARLLWSGIWHSYLPIFLTPQLLILSNNFQNMKQKLHQLDNCDISRSVLLFSLKSEVIAWMCANFSFSDRTVSPRWRYIQHCLWLVLRRIELLILNHLANSIVIDHQEMVNIWKF